MAKDAIFVLDDEAKAIADELSRELGMSDHREVLQFCLGFVERVVQHRQHGRKICACRDGVPVFELHLPEPPKPH